MPSGNDFKVSIKFGLQRWPKISFTRAADMIETYVKTEHAACDRLVKQINRDHLLASFWSEVLGGAYQPHYVLWLRPITSLRSARSAYRGGNYVAAREHLLRAIARYNEVHKKWVAYRYRLDAGGRAAIACMEVTITVLSTAASVGYGASLAAQSSALGGAAALSGRAAAVKGAAVAAGLSGGATAARQLGLVAYGVEKKVDVAKIALDAGSAFVTSLVGGKLAEKFLGLMTPRVAAALSADHVSAARAANILLPAGYSPSQTLLSEFLTGAGTNLIAEAVRTAATKAKGKSMTMDDFMKLVVQEVRKEKLATVLKAYLAANKP